MVMKIKEMYFCRPTQFVQQKKKIPFILITAENKLCDKFMIFKNFQDDLHFHFFKTNEQTTSEVLLMYFIL